MDVATRLKLARERRGLSQRQLAHESGASASYIQKVEAGVIVNPGTDKLKDIAVFLGDSAEWLAWGTGDRPDWFVEAVET